MAYVRRVGSKWKAEIRVVVRGEQVKENLTRDTEEDARRDGALREEELRRVAAGGFARATVRKLMERWRDEVAPTRDGKRWDVNRINAILARMAQLGYDTMDVSEFGPREMAQLRKLRLAEIAPPSVKREETLLKAIWAAARHPEWAMTDVDPFRDLGGIRGSKGRPRTRKGEAWEIKRLLRQLGYHPMRPPSSKTAEVGLALLLSLRTTLRSKEVLQLGDDLVNLDRLVLTIPAHKTRYVTNDDKRVPILPKALVLLTRQCLGRGRYFTVGPGSRDTLYRRARDFLGIEDLKFHDMKRTAVGMLKERMTDRELMAATGNADIEVLRRHYMTDTAAEAANGLWRAAGADRARLVRTAAACLASGAS